MTVKEKWYQASRQANLLAPNNLHIHIPKEIFEELNASVLVMSFIGGVKGQDAGYLATLNTAYLAGYNQACENMGKIDMDKDIEIKTS